MAIGYQPPRIAENKRGDAMSERDDYEENSEDRAVSEDELQAIVAGEIARAVVASDENEKRERTIQHFQGFFPDLPHKAGRSSFTSREVSDTVGWILPGLMRIFAGSTRVVNFIPNGPGDEKMADQASDGVVHQFYNKNKGYKILRDASFDALLHSYAVVKQYWEEYPKVETQRLTGVTQEQIDILRGEDCEITDIRPSDQGTWIDPDEQAAYEQAMQEQEAAAQAAMQAPPEGEPDPAMAQQAMEDPMAAPQDPMAPPPEAPPPAPEPPPPPPQPPVEHELFDCKAVHRSKAGHICYKVVAGEDFIRDRGATCIEDARLLGQRSEPTRSELVEMGFDADDVYALPSISGISHLDGVKAARNNDDDDLLGDNYLHASMEKIEFYEVFLKVDVDGDGIAESVRAYYAGASGAGKLLYAEEWDSEWPFDIIPCNPMSHKFSGRSAHDDVEDIAEINTVLTRGLFDNIYATNVPMIEAEEGSVVNPEILQNPKFGATIWRKKGTMATAPLTPFSIPFVGQHIVEALELTANMVEKRTGVSRTTMALDPSAYQDQTATAAQLQTSASYAKLELMARDMAELGWKEVFKKSYRLLVRHQDRKETVRLRGKWVEIDPSWWNAEMDCEVDVGLGTGSNEKDIAALENIFQKQLQTMQMLQNSGASDEAVALLPKIVRTATRQAQASNIKDAAGYYPELTEDDIPRLQQKMQEQSQSPPLEIQIEQERQKGAQALEQLRAQTTQASEQAKGALTMQIEEAKNAATLQMDQQRLRQEGIAKMAELDAQLQRDAEAEEMKMRAQANTELAQLQADMQTKELEFAYKQQIEELKAETEAWKVRTVEQNKWDIAVLQAQVTAATVDTNNEAKAEQNDQNNFAKSEQNAQNNDAKLQTAKIGAKAKVTVSDAGKVSGQEPEKPKKRKFRVIRDKDGRMEGAEEYD